MSDETAGNGNKFLITLAWNALWMRTGPNGEPNPYYLPNMILNGVTSDGVTVDPLGTVSIDAVPNVQLLESKDMAPLPWESGSISIGFSDVVIGGFDTLGDGGLTYTADPDDPNLATISATLTSTSMAARGSYAVLASGMAQCALDTAGSLLALPGRVDEDEPVAPVAPMETMLAAARTQRTKLWQTPKGGVLMDRFYDHNEVYNALYADTGSPLVVGWTTSAVLQNANETYVAVRDDTVVNTSEEFNTESFVQALSLYGACTSASANAATLHYPMDSDTYADAGRAVLNFFKPVSTTGNSPDRYTPLTPGGIFADVAKGAGPFPEQSIDQMLGPRERAVIEDMARAMNVHHHAWMAAAEALADENKTIFNGPVAIALVGTTSLTLNLTADFSGAEPVLTLTSVDATLPQPGIDIDVAAWSQGTYASLGSQLLPAFENATFLRNYVHDLIADQVEGSKVVDYLQAVLTDAVTKALGPLPEA